MKRVTLATTLALALLSCGCSERFGILRPQRNTAAAQPIPKNVPTAEQLVAYLNDNSSRIQGLSSSSVDITVSADGQSFGLRGKLMAQKNRNFRMNAGTLGKNMVDLGSNDKEFWYWVSELRPNHQFYCNYDDMAGGRVKFMPLPVQPDWLMETLGFGPFGPAEKYELKVENDKLELVERTRGPKGNPIRKVIVFNRRIVQPPDPQVLAHVLIDDATGQEICSARITDVQVDRHSNAIVPRRTELRCPTEKITMAMKLDSLTVNPQIPDTLFVRKSLPGVQSFNLAQGRVDSPVSIQQVGGIRGAFGGQ